MTAAIIDFANLLLSGLLVGVHHCGAADAAGGGAASGSFGRCSAVAADEGVTPQNVFSPAATELMIRS